MWIGCLLCCIDELEIFMWCYLIDRLCGVCVLVMIVCWCWVVVMCWIGNCSSFELFGVVVCCVGCRLVCVLVW